MKNRIKKMISLTMVIILLLAAFASCGDNKRPTLSERKKEAINEAWMKKADETLSWSDIDAGVYSGARYYGTFNGFDIILIEYVSVVDSGGHMVVAKYVFRHNTSFNLYAYKDGVFYTLNEAYENTLLTRKQIKKIYDIHWNKYQKTLYPELYNTYYKD